MKEILRARRQARDAVAGAATVSTAPSRVRKDRCSRAMVSDASYAGKSIYMEQC